MDTKNNSTKMLPIKIGWTSDWHIRNSQYARTSRGDDFDKAVYNCVQSMIDENVDIAINCGDIFNVSRPSPRNIATLMRVDAMLKKAGIPMYSITGNHDMSHPTWLSTLFPDAEGAGIIPVDDKVVTVEGGLTLANVTPKTTSVFKKMVEDGTLPDADVFLYHILVNDFIGFDDPKQLSISDLPTDKYKAILLGDIHVSEAQVVDGCFLGYPGSVEMCSSSEDPVKSWMLLNWDGKEMTKEKRVVFKTRYFRKFTIRTEEELDEAVKSLNAVADEHPVVVAKYDPAIRDTIKRIYNTVDPSKAVIKLTPLPSVGVDLHEVRAASDKNEDIPLSSFMADYLEGVPERMVEAAVSIAMHPDTDAHGVLAMAMEDTLKEQKVKL